MIKAEHPDLEGKQRHQIIRAKWQTLPDDKKFNYVMMSRADREKAVYIAKLIQLKETLPFDIPSSIAKHFPETKETNAKAPDAKRVFAYTQTAPATGVKGPIIYEDVDGETSSGTDCLDKVSVQLDTKPRPAQPKKDGKFVQLSIV